MRIKIIIKRKNQKMYTNQSIHKGDKVQNILETIIILIAFVVVATVFAITMLSAESASTEKDKQAIQAGLDGIQSSMSVKGSVIAEGSGRSISYAIFTLSLVAGGSPVNLSATAKEVVVGYKDATQYENDVPWTIKWIVSKQATADDMLEEGELAEITVDLSGLGTALGTNTAFNLEIKPPKGAVLNLNRTTPAAIQPVMDLN
jgi:archaeal flagellin FlaB